MAVLTVQSPAKPGSVVTYSAASGGGDKVTNNGRVMIAVKNGDASSHDVTVSAQKSCSFGVSNAAHDSVTSVAAGAEKLIGPFSPDQFNDVNGQINIAYTAVTSVTIAAFTVA
jgi:hypothetical protein